MGNKKPKKKKLFKHYKLFIVIGGVFHIISWKFYEKTLFNENLYWGSALLCGLIFAIFFINKTDLLNPKSYKKLNGIKLKSYMLFIGIVMTVGGIIVFGSVINGTVLGLNYIGKSNVSIVVELQVEKIVRNYSTGGRRRTGRNNPKVYLKENEILKSFNLPERWDSNANYAEYKSIELNLKTGLFGLEIIDEYVLKK